jgi:NADPH:quinone reductase-like Zn-dependent oxidoreductase
MSTTATTLPNPTTTRAAALAEPMQALLQRGYGGPEVLRTGEIAMPTAGEGEVLVKVHAAGIDRGTWHLMTGRPYLMRVMGFGFRAPKQPVAGLDLAGTVVALGAGVTKLRVGDRVFGIGRGSMAEYTCAREDKLAVIPNGASFEDAAVLGVSGITALQAIDAGGLVAGERVLVIGASGGVGTFAVQIARANGAVVTGVCSTAKVEMVRSLGAHDVIDYRTQDFTSGTTKYDLVIDVGGNTPLSRLRRTLTDTGRLVFVGGENGGDWTAGFGRVLFAMLLGMFVKQRFVMLASKEHSSYLERVAALFAAGELRAVIDRRIRLEDVPAALVELEAGRVAGKIVVQVAASRAS